ncbi:hypothetical protein [Bdellovibrio sp.]|uniref:hypothetical protein n=1 Tax=Bdellovibrio sp. TaxID=28201 RepID=UPI0039E25868
MTFRIFPTSLAILTLLFFGVDYFQMVSSNHSFSKTEIQFRKDLNVYLSKTTQGYLNDQNADIACRSLKEAYNNGYIAFFMIRHEKNGVLCFENKEHDVSKINLRYKIFDELVSTPKSGTAYRATDIGSYLLVTGSVNDSDEQIKAMQEARNKYAWYYFLKGLVIFALVLYLVLAPLFGSIRSVSEKGFISQKLLSWANRLLRFSEFDTLARASEATYFKLKETEEELALVSSTVTKKLLDEVKQSGHKLPINFDATILRFDLNDYTKTFLNTHPEDMLDLMVRYAAISDELINRHDGLVYQFIGDEFVVVFKNDDKNMHNRNLRATCCIRDIFNSLEDIGGPRAFTLKASISTSKLWFMKLPFGYFYAGLALIKSQRMLNEIADKDRNRLIVESAMTDEIKQIAILNNAQNVLFKGFSSNETITFVDSFFSETPTEYLPKTDQCIVEIMNSLRQTPDSAENLIKTLRSFKPGYVSDDVLRAYASTLQIYTSFEIGTKFPTATETFMMVGRTLIPKGQWTIDLTTSILAIEEGVSPRIYANAIETLLEKVPFATVASSIELLKKKIPDNYYRLMGNVLSGRIKQEPNRILLKDLLDLLKSNNERLVTTGIWIARDSLPLVLRQNPTKLKIFSEYNRILESLNNLLSVPIYNESAQSAIFEIRRADTFIEG